MSEYDEERYLHEVLESLRGNYVKAAKPYIDSLVQIRSLRPMPPLLVTTEQARALGLIAPAEAAAEATK